VQATARWQGLCFRKALLLPTALLPAQCRIWRSLEANVRQCAFVTLQELFRFQDMSSEGILTF
jgi:hypothetical protein